LIESEFNFVQKLKDEDITWSEIAKEFAEEFEQAVTIEAIRNRYRRELRFRKSITNNDLLDRALSIIKQSPIKPTELAKRLDLDLDGLEGLLDDVISQRAAVKFHNNYLVFDVNTPQAENRRLKIDDWFNEEQTVKVACISDTHCCSIYECPDKLQLFYEICLQENVSAVLHAGDMFAGGGNMFKGQYQELKIIGADRQKQYVASTYPNVGIPTFVISGNHDLDYYKTAGIDIVDQLCDIREDITYLGQLGAYLELSGVTFYVAHGEGGVPYARSYKPQKLLEGFDVNTLPDVAIWGHWHITDHLPKFKGVISICPGCFERQSSYLKRKGLFPDIGGIILEMTLADTPKGKKIVRHKCEFIDMDY
jgi:predicted phosphodiesterase